jgi:hypothetical protein
MNKNKISNNSQQWNPNVWLARKCIIEIKLSKHIVEENLNSIIHQIMSDLFILHALKRWKIYNIYTIHIYTQYIYNILS